MTFFYIAGTALVVTFAVFAWALIRIVSRGDSRMRDIYEHENKR